MAENGDEGLQRALGPWALGANVVNVTVGAGIFVLPAALYREIGTAAPLAYLACTVMMAGVVICFAAAGSRVPTSGGAYGFVQEAFGPFMGFFMGVLYWLSAVLATAGIAAAVADILGQVLPALAQPLIRGGVIVALLGALAAVNIAGAKVGARLVELTALIKLLPLAALLVLGFPHIDPGAFFAHGAVGAGFGRAMLLAIFAFQGMETAIGVSGEVRDPARNVPRGLIGAMANVAILYVLVQLVVQGVLGPALASSKSPLADAASVISAPLGSVLLVGATASMFGYLAGDALGSPRTLFAFGRDGFLPSALGGVYRRTGAPVAAIIAHEVIAAALAFSGGFVQLVTLSALATVALYVVGCVAAVVLQRRGTAHAGPPLHVPGLWLAATVGTGGMIWLTLNAKPVELLGLMATAAVSGILYLIARFRKRRVAAL